MPTENGIKISLKTIGYIIASILALGIAFGALKVDSKDNADNIEEIKPIVYKNRGDMRELKTDVKYIRESLVRIEAKIDKNGKKRR